MVVYISKMELEAHMLLLPKAIKYSRELTTLMAKILFKKVDRISTVIIDGMNTAKNHVEKVGFMLEGIKRECFMVGGIKKDAYIYGLLKSEFKG